LSSSVQKLIEAKVRSKGSVRVADIVRATGFSRAYIHRSFNHLEAQGRIFRVGKANRARYVAATKSSLRRAMQSEVTFQRMLHNEGISEDHVLAEIKRETGIFHHLPANVSHILDYAFTEMLNNAIEHSQSKNITVRVIRNRRGIAFRVRDQGIGIFRNIMRRRRLKNESEAIQDLLKGKQTTAPQRHSGEGIFFTSKAVDFMVLRGSKKKVIFDNRLRDVFIREVKPITGTVVDCMVMRSSKAILRNVFNRYSGPGFGFGKTAITVRLFAEGEGYVSRSQARRILSGLEKFGTIVLDFRGVRLVGQGFADEVFRVWKHSHPDVRFEIRNASKDVEFMIHRLGAEGHQH
jgi:anti-sigma regulatory factor (Ser/Thr protein kinase)